MCNSQQTFLELKSDTNVTRANWIYLGYITLVHSTCPDWYERTNYWRHEWKVFQYIYINKYMSFHSLLNRNIKTSKNSTNEANLRPYDDNWNPFRICGVKKAKSFPNLASFLNAWNKQRNPFKFCGFSGAGFSQSLKKVELSKLVAQDLKT